MPVRAFAVRFHSMRLSLREIDAFSTYLAFSAHIRRFSSRSIDRPTAHRPTADTAAADCGQRNRRLGRHQVVLAVRDNRLKFEDVTRSEVFAVARHAAR